MGGGRGLPVRLVKADVEGSGPVGEDRLLRDEAVVAPPSTPLVGEIHGALVRPAGLVVVIRHGGMGGGSVRKVERERERGRKRAEKLRESKCEGGVWKR